MLNQDTIGKSWSGESPVLAGASIAGYFIIDRQGTLIQANDFIKRTYGCTGDILGSFPMLQRHLNDSSGTGIFYQLDSRSTFAGIKQGERAVYIGSLPGEDKIIGIIYEGIIPEIAPENMRSENFILSLITQAVRAFNRAVDLEDILKIVLIGVTAGSGLGFNRAFVLLTCDDHKCLKGALANGPSSPEEAGVIWQKLSCGELTLEKMFDEALKKEEDNNPLLNGFVKKLRIPLDNKDNIFVRAALEKKSMIIDAMTLTKDQYSELHLRIGPGPLAVVPLAGAEDLQGVLIADNFITRKSITDNSLHLLEIFARYASDSIEKFRLYDSLAKKVEALKKANETIILNRENVLRAERLTVLSEMAREVAHEIRNPLTIIGGFTKSLLKKMTPQDSDYETFNIIIDQVARIEQTLEKFTSLMNYQEKDDRVCDLDEIVRSALAISFPGSGIFKMDGGAPATIMVKLDPDLFRQALLLITRRIKKICKCHDSILLSIAKAGDKALIYFKSVCDNGNLAGELYRSFNSLGTHQKIKELFTSLEIIKYYGGNIGIEIADNQAKRFYLELPLYQEAS
jgi:signal transduction histidine kinase